MGITKSKGYLDSKGVLHATVEGAQKAELVKLFLNGQGLTWTPDELADHILKDDVATALLGVLTLTPRSKPKARKHAGTVAPKRARKQTVTEAPAAPQVAADGFKAMHEAVETVEA